MKTSCGAAGNQLKKNKSAPEISKSKLSNQPNLKKFFSPDRSKVDSKVNQKEERAMTGKGKNDLVTVESLKVILAEMLDERLAGLQELIKKVDKLEKAQRELEERVEERATEQDRYSRKNNLIFHGIPVKAKEDALQVVEDMGKALGVQILPDHVDAAHRLPSRNEKLPPPFIIKFVNRWRKEKVLAAAKVRKPTAACMGGSKELKIFCNEHLAPKKQVLFTEARRMKEKYFVWCQGGDVLCRKKEDGARIQQIRRLEDIDALVGPKVEDGNRNQLRWAQRPGRGAALASATEEVEDRLNQLKQQFNKITSAAEKTADDTAANDTLASQGLVLQG